MPELSLIIPVMNEAPNISSLSARINAALATIDHEVIWVNDGSSDDTSEKIKAYSSPQTILIDLGKNYGQSAAIQAGIWQSKGHYIATIDGDGQNDPNDLLLMLQILKENRLDMVAGIRIDRKDKFFRSFVSGIANILIRFVTGTRFRDLGCSTRIMRREMAFSLPLKKGMHRYINVLLAKKNATIRQVSVNHGPRSAGKSKYGMGRIIPVLRDLISIKKMASMQGPYRVQHFSITSLWYGVASKVPA